MSSLFLWLRQGLTPLGFDLFLFLVIFWLRAFLSIDLSLFFLVKTSTFVFAKKSCFFLSYFTYIFGFSLLTYFIVF